MWKWLRSLFAWRYSLRRLVIATVFLGAFVGLSMREVSLYREYDPDRERIEGISAWGWPFAFICKPWHQAGVSPATTDEVPLPFTHQTYDLLNCGTLIWADRFGEFSIFTTGLIIDPLVGLIPLALILFLQIPHRKPTAQGQR